MGGGRWGVKCGCGACVNLLLLVLSRQPPGRSAHQRRDGQGDKRQTKLVCLQIKAWTVGVVKVCTHLQSWHSPCALLANDSNSARRGLRRVTGPAPLLQLLLDAAAAISGPFPPHFTLLSWSRAPKY